MNLIIMRVAVLCIVDLFKVIYKTFINKLLIIFHLIKIIYSYKII